MNKDHLAYCASPEWREIVEKVILPEALQGIDLGPEVIEIGPGPGFTTDVLRNLTSHLTAVEIDPELAASLERRLAGSNVEVLCGDAASLDFRDNAFSGAASFHMLHHIEDDRDQDRVFAELHRVLKTSGVLVAGDGVYNEDSAAFHEGDIYNPIDPDDLASRLTAAGFEKIDARRYVRGWVCTAVAG
jgi:SAM-dependent methyltransferase